MNHRFQIIAEWESLDEDSPEENCCFAALGIRANNIWFTEGRDALANRLRTSPYLSGYQLAEWFAWNWWRLRWEPQSYSVDWDLAHCMANIGGGYIWPNIKIFSDGQRTALISKAGLSQDESPFRYIVDSAAILPSSEFEVGIDAFIAQVLEHLDACGIRNSNLNTLWGEISQERADSEIARIRKVEALLGLQPDELDDATREAFFSREEEFGKGAIDELAADRGSQRNSVTIRPDALVAEVKNAGYQINKNDAVSISSEFSSMQNLSATPAWKVGAQLAKTLREQEHLGDDTVISDKLLSQLISVDLSALSGKNTTASGISCLFAGKNGKGQVMLRSKWKTGRRFELARLLGDFLVESGDNLHPATRAGTYRQKMQRSFAAELLSPFTAVLNHLQGDFSEEAQAGVAKYFKVSEMTIRTQLVNHQIIDRDYINTDAEAWEFAA